MNREQLVKAFTDILFKGKIESFEVEQASEIIHETEWKIIVLASPEDVVSETGVIWSRCLCNKTSLILSISKSLINIEIDHHNVLAFTPNKLSNYRGNVEPKKKYEKVHALA